MHTFVFLINNIKLAKKETGGFGMMRVPILTHDQANIIAAWYYAVLLERNSNNKLSDIQKANLEDIKSRKPDEIRQVSLWANKFTLIAKNQINPTSANINQIISEVSILIDSCRLDSLPKPILTHQSLPMEVRTPGDDTGKFLLFLRCQSGKTRKEMGSSKNCFSGIYSTSSIFQWRKTAPYLFLMYSFLICFTIKAIS